MITPAKYRASEPREPRRYTGESYKGRKCPKHKVKLVLESEGSSCDCCGDFDPEYRCPKCEALYDKAHAKWFRKFGHFVAVANYLDVVDGKIRRMFPDLRYMQFLHGGKPIKLGSWCKVNEKTGYIVRTAKPGEPNMLVIS